MMSRGHPLGKISTSADGRRPIFILRIELRSQRTLPGCLVQYHVTFLIRFNRVNPLQRGSLTIEVFRTTTLFYFGTLDLYPQTFL